MNDTHKHYAKIHVLFQRVKCHQNYDSHSLASLER